MANSTLEILINAKDNASGAMKNVAASAQAMGNQVEAASKKMETAGTRARSFEQAAGKIDSAGRNARIGLSSMAQAADLVGVNISGIIGPAASAADAIGDVVGAVGALGIAGGVLGGIILAIGLVKQNYDDMIARRAKAIMSSDPWIQSLRQEKQVTEEAAAAMQKYAEAIAKAEAAQGRGGGRAADALARSAKYMAEEVDKAAEALWRLTAAQGAAGEKLKELQGATGGLVGTTYDEIEAQRQHNLYLANFTDIQDEALAGMVDVRKEGEKKADPQILEDWKNRTSAVKKFGDAASIAASKLRGLLEGALQAPDFSAHLAKIESGGKDAFENMFRFDAVATGTDPAQYGEKFAALSEQLAGMGISAEQAAKGMRDFSIFASNPELINAGLIDMSVVIEDVKSQINGMIGKALFMKSAMQEVWASLSQPQKSALAEQGIENVDDAMTALLDPAGQAKTEVQKLGAAIGAIPSTITSTFYVVKDAAEQAIKDFREVLDQFIADYGNVTISINAETSTTAPGTTPTAPAPTLPVEREKLANGGSFIVPSRYGYEGFGMGGIASASAGERVTVTPRGQSGGQFVFNVSVSNDAMLNALMRKVRGLAMMNAT